MTFKQRETPSSPCLLVSLSPCLLVTLSIYQSAPQRLRSRRRPARPAKATKAAIILRAVRRDRRGLGYCHHVASLERRRAVSAAARDLGLAIARGPGRDGDGDGCSPRALQQRDRLGAARRLDRAA